MEHFDSHIYDPRIDELRKRAVNVRNNTIDGLIELNRLEKELVELRKEEERGC